MLVRLFHGNVLETSQIFAEVNFVDPDAPKEHSLSVEEVMNIEVY